MYGQTPCLQPNQSRKAIRSFRFLHALARSGQNSPNACILTFGEGRNLEIDAEIRLLAAARLGWLGWLDLADYRDWNMHSNLRE